MKLVLASNSPRRKELLAMLGLKPEIFVPKVDESCDRTAFSPDELVMGLASRKARAASEELAALGRDMESLVLLAADTVVALDGQILEKPKNQEDARRMLRALSGRRHAVYTGIALLSGNRLAVEAEETAVEFRTLGESEIERYIASGEPMDKAGAYGIQARGCLFVNRIEGDYYNVVGLPLAHLDALLLKTFGFGLTRFTEHTENTKHSEDGTAE